MTPYEKNLQELAERFAKEKDKKYYNERARLEGYAAIALEFAAKEADIAFSQGAGGDFESPYAYQYIIHAGLMPDKNENDGNNKGV